jgi:hypothetical protein
MRPGGWYGPVRASACLHYRAASTGWLGRLELELAHEQSV